MNAQNGRMMPPREHLAQSVRNILFTRIGTRVQREEYGSLLPDLIDMPMNPVTVMLCRVAAVDALARWEPRIRIKMIDVEASPEDGRLKIAMAYEAAMGETDRLEVVL